MRDPKARDPEARSRMGDDALLQALARGGTRSTLRLGPAMPVPAAPRAEEVHLLPIVVGPHRLAIEVARVVEIFPGGEWTAPPDPQRPVALPDLHRELGALAVQEREMILARADGLSGRGPGRYVAFAVDRAERLVKAPLENICPLPEVARDQIGISFIAGVVRFPWPDDGLAFLLDPQLLSLCEEDEHGR
jgi:chemotaxis signal transduction protein